MERFDVIVVGSGSGMLVASVAVEQGLNVALVEQGKMGGTCINVGCVPSKMLIYPADLISSLGNAKKLGVNTTTNSVDFNNIMIRMHELVNHDSGHQASAVEATPNLTWYKDTGYFISDYTMQVGTRTVSARMIFIASGAHTTIPSIKGIENVNYLTSDTTLELKTAPMSILIVGGGYIGMEYGHFFSSIGVKTTIIQRPKHILPDEEVEISNLLRNQIEGKIEIFSGHEVVEAKQESNTKIIIAKNLETGKLLEFSADAILIATGRSSNANNLKPQQTGVKLNEQGFIEVNEYLETSKKNIWAFGDAIGKLMFKHAANYEAGVVWHNANHDHKIEMNYAAVPHAVFTYPQIASVGLKSEEAKQQNYKILVGKALYKDTAMGAAMGFPDGFVKVVVEEETGKILGAHIIGHEASILIQEIVNAMVSGEGTYSPIARGIHIHPALSEVVQNAFGNLQPA